MATGTAATNAALTALAMPGSFITPDGIAVGLTRLDTDVATIQQLIKDDLNPAQPINLSTGGWSRAGMLFIPNRGFLKCLPGDVVCVDAATGWPILLSRRAANTAASWTLTGPP